jgi:ribonucleoside-diphosphate reductase alpha chain
MRLASDIHPTAPLANPILGEESTTPSSERYADYKIVRRNGAVVGFEPDKIAVAMTKAFLAVHGNTAAASAGVRDKVAALTEAVVQSLMRRHPAGGTFHIEDVQDQVELAMMRAGEHQVARSYVIYREERASERAKRVQEAAEAQKPQIHVMVGGAKEPLDMAKLEALISNACEHLHEGSEVSPAKIMDATLRDLYDGVPLEEMHKCAILAARMLIEQDPDYTYVTARLLLHTIRREVLGEEVMHAEMATRYAEYFPTFISNGVKAQLLDERLASYDLKRLGAALKPIRDLQFNYLGLQTLYDRYFLHIHEKRIELPQAFFMRVAMGLALNEINREDRAIEFYTSCLRLHVVDAHPLNSGTLRCSFLLSHDGRRRPDGIMKPSRKTRSSASSPADSETTDASAHWLLHQGNQWKIRVWFRSSRSSRHGGRGKPGRQEERRGLLLPRDVAPGHRGIPRAPQEHGRRPAPHARHEHRELDSGSLHEARDGRRRMDALLALGCDGPSRQGG